MFILVPCLLVVALAHRYLLAYAPSNVLIRHVRRLPPSWKVVTLLVLLSGLLILVMHAVEAAIDVGAPEWVHLLTALLAWDALKVGFLGIHVAVRGAWPAARAVVASGQDGAPA